MWKVELVFPGILVSYWLHWNHTHTVGYMLDHIRHTCAASYSVFQTSGLLHFFAARFVFRSLSRYPAHWSRVQDIARNVNLKSVQPGQTSHWEDTTLLLNQYPQGRVFVLGVLQTGRSRRNGKVLLPPSVMKCKTPSKWPALKPESYAALHFWGAFITRESTGPGASCPLCV